MDNVIRSFLESISYMFIGVAIAISHDVILNMILTQYNEQNPQLPKKKSKRKDRGLFYSLMSLSWPIYLVTMFFALPFLAYRIGMFNVQGKALVRNIGWLMFVITMIAYYLAIVGAMILSAHKS